MNYPSKFALKFLKAHYFQYMTSPMLKLLTLPPKPLLLTSPPYPIYIA